MPTMTPFQSRSHRCPTEESMIQESLQLAIVEPNYEDERATKYKDILYEEDTLLHHSSWKRNAPSIDTQPPQRNRKRASTDIANYSSIDAEVNRDPDGHTRAIDGRILNVSRKDIADILQIANGAEILFVHQRNIPEYQQKDTKEFYDADGGIDKSFKIRSCNPTPPSIDIAIPTSIDRQPKFCRRAFDSHGTRRFYWEEKDQRVLERASRDEPSYLCLPEHANLFTQTKLVPEIYTKDEINEMFYGVCGKQENNKEAFQMKLDGVYYPLNDSTS
ncbi:hypothetical protein F2Q68_00041144 [Brassica cretica]|uniref:Uncharacterized protein n=1 Tax=Brassica cretica TaxID=69181 RepID=A0A8S9MAE7_BRACR|nr:hypothetical protein F2Q68_00041144 [Brassica cretica]